MAAPPVPGGWYAGTSPARCNTVDNRTITSAGIRCQLAVSRPQTEQWGWASPRGDFELLPGGRSQLGAGERLAAGQRPIYQ